MRLAGKLPGPCQVLHPAVSLGRHGAGGLAERVHPLGHPILWELPVRLGWPIRLKTGCGRKNGLESGRSTPLGTTRQPTWFLCSGSVGCAQHKEHSETPAGSCETENIRNPNDNSRICHGRTETTQMEQSSLRGRVEPMQHCPRFGGAVSSARTHYDSSFG